MSLLAWFDNRTLFGCQCFLTLLFATVFLWMGRAYPQIRGVRMVALAFALGVPCTLLMTLRGVAAPFLSITAANLLAMGAFLALYEGVVRFAGTKSHWKMLAVPGALAIGVVYYFSGVRPNIVPRIMAMGFATAIIRGATAWVLLGLAGGEVRMNARTQRVWGARLLLGSFLALLTVLEVERIAATAVLGSPEDYMQRNAFQTSTMALNLVFIAVFGLCFLIMSSQELIARSQEESERDVLSGALNRRGIEARLAQELKRRGRSGQRLCVALVDLDRFKEINDAEGHAAGDEALRATAKAMQERLRDLDTMGRYGGDEFLVILPHTGLENTPVVAERLSLAIGRLDVLHGGHRLSVSIGMTEASSEDDAIALIARADEALYQAKRAGRACWRMVAPEGAYPLEAPRYGTHIEARG